MFFLNDITLVIPSIVNNISQKWIHQINHYCENSISIIISVPPFMDIKKIYDKGFSKDILILNSDKKGQVVQRQFAYKYSKTELIMHMDDDVFFDLESLKGLLQIFNNLPEKSCLAPSLNNKIKKTSFPFNIFINIRNLLLFSDLNPKPGSISSTSFPVPHCNKNNKNYIQKVEWLPGGISLIRKKHCITKDYFKFKGKAYCEDLFLSSILTKNKINLFLSNKILYETKIESYRFLSFSQFINFIKEDFKIRNFYRKTINISFIRFVIAYFYLITAFLITKSLKFIIF